MSEFDETTFVDRRDYPDYLLTPVQRKQMIALRFMYPELGHWSLFGLFCALLAYSFDVRIPELNARDDMFLSFCYLRQIYPELRFASREIYLILNKDLPQFR